MKTAILTSVETRHRYFANTLRERLPVVAVGYEQTGYDPALVAEHSLTAEEKRIVADHFAERSRQEEIFFGEKSKPIESDDTCAVLDVAPGTLNSDATIDFLRSSGADTIVVYGTNLIGAALIKRWAGRLINMHLGLSPYYRGTATNFYPLLNEEPEYIGATIHLIDAGIDTGEILKHARPTIAADDGPHTIGCKAILAGIGAMIDVLTQLQREGRISGVPQWKVPNPHLYLRRDYHPRQVVELYKKLEGGLMARCVAKIANGAAPPRLVD